MLFQYNKIDFNVRINCDIAVHVSLYVLIKQNNIVYWNKDTKKM